jgi:glycosyltransferase involved in cell wall biosynthesis
MSVRGTPAHSGDALAAERPAAPAVRVYDGVICLGGVDWWYHNRGHYDLQMMRELSRDVPVLYVNSIGMRVPRLAEGKMFVRRVRRKLTSLRRGLVRVRDNFYVYSPVAAPGRVGAAVTRATLAAQIGRAAERAGIRRPLLWVACPPGAQVLDALPHRGLVYQRTDRFEAFGGVDRARIAAYDRLLKRRADLTLYCSRSLHEEEAAGCGRAAFIDHGVDFTEFASAAENGVVPADVAAIPRPRIGFVGGIDAHTFDPTLFRAIARACPDLHFVLVGACSLTRGWCGDASGDALPNVHLLGRRGYTDVPAYMSSCDVLIMPWNSSPWIKACNPVKLKEYLAVGRPVVSTPFDELEHYRGLVRRVRTAEEFAYAIRAALASPHDPAPGRDRVRAETWAAKADRVAGELATLGIVPGGARA